MNKSDNVLEDMQEDNFPSSNGVQPNVPPITIPDLSETVTTDELKDYLNDDGLRLLLGDDKTMNEMAADLTEKKKEVTFSNMSLDSKDVEYAKKYFDAYRVKLSDNIPKPVAVIKLGGRAIATVADMTTITGQANSYMLTRQL